MKNEICLLITGCISPNINTPKLALKDCTIRREQYIDSIKYYIKNSNITSIVFCDNSCAEKSDNLDILAAHYKKKFEWLSFQGNTEAIISHGKGYGEGEITKYAIENSKLLQETDIIIKVTGRLVVKNIDSVARISSTKFGYFDFYSKKERKVDTRCYSVPKKLYIDRLIDTYKRVDDYSKFYYEHAFYEEMIKSIEQFRQLPFSLRIFGQSGSTGAPYKESIFKYTAKCIINLFKSIVFEWSLD